MGQDICKICSSNKLSVVTIGQTKLIHCAECDIYYQTSIPGQTELNQYYTENYNLTKAGFIPTEKRRIFRIPEQIGIIAEIRQLNPPPASLLDIGCDRGYFIDEARRYGYEVTGLEPSAAAAEYCRQIGLPVVKNFDDLKKQFDIVTMFHSLEHHDDPLKAMVNLKKYLVPDGLIVIRVPNFSCVWRKIFRERWTWFQPKNHYFHFTQQSLYYLMMKAGYNILSIESRKPNTRLTKRMNHMSNSIFKKSFHEPVKFIDRIKRHYEDITGVELFCTARNLK